MSQEPMLPLGVRLTVDVQARQGRDCVLNGRTTVGGLSLVDRPID
jgi:hypothetical protein